jgi:5-formyltetrahydrofolate cyclo-ligase
MSRFDWQGEQLSELGRRVRKTLRARMRATRGALPAAALAARSARIVHALSGIEALRRARAVGLFWPIEAQSEVDLRLLDAELNERGVARYYPFMDPSDTGYVTGFRRIERTEELELRGQAFAEPPRGAKLALRGDLDLIIVPALGATPDGHRLGFGSGFYDATLPDHCPPALTIIVAFSFQVLAELPLEPHDFRCDAVVTDESIYDPRGGVAQQ